MKCVPRVGLYIPLLIGLSACPGQEKVSITPPEGDVCTGESANLVVTGTGTESRFAVRTRSTRAALTGQVSPSGVEATGRISEVDSRNNGADEVAFQIVCLSEGPADFRVIGFEIEDPTFDRSVTVNCIDCGNPDPVADFIDSVSSREPTFTGGFFDQVAFGARELVALAGELAAFNDFLPCASEEESGLVVCADQLPTTSTEETSMVHVSMKFAETIPRRAGDSLIYSAVFETDGDPANDWLFQPPFDWDLFQGTERWYQAIYDHTQERWRLVVTIVNPGPPQTQSEVESAAKVIVDGPQLTFLIPRSELGEGTPRVRTTSFGHDGFFSENRRGADVCGANPTEAPHPVN